MVGAIAILALVSFGVFSLMHLAPGSIENALLPPGEATPEIREFIRQKYHLDEPFIVQYWYWVRGAITLDWGTSIRTSEPVLTVIANRLDVTLWLATTAIVLVLLTALPLGVIAALRRGRLTDRLVVAGSVFGVSSPPFAVGLVMMYVFAVALGWFPALGAGSGFWDRLSHMILPAVTLAISSSALVVKITRVAMIDALQMDFVTFARARGVTPIVVVTRYALRNSLIPVVTALSMVIGALVSGAVLVEVTFSLPGIGSLLIEAVNFNDVPVVQGVALYTAVVIVVATLVTDLLYMVIDPRIRLGRQA